MERRSPHGERGLKFAGDVRGSLAWSRSPHGERGLKLRQGVRRTVEHPSRSPHGERGLKCGKRHEL